MPTEFGEYYQQGLQELNLYVLDNIKNKLDKDIFTIALATLATCKGQIKLGKAIMEMIDQDIMEEFLEQF